MTELASLVSARRGQLNLSLANLSAAAVDPEGGTSVSSGWIHRLEKGHPVIPPQAPQLRALAAGLQVPLARVQEAAAAQFFGLDSGGTPAEVLALARRIGGLAADQQAALLGFLDAFEGDS
ncbi:XRE family transcriptional regulator [Streptomyces zhihengii]